MSTCRHLMYLHDRRTGPECVTMTDGHACGTAAGRPLASSWSTRRQENVQPYDRPQSLLDTCVCRRHSRIIRRSARPRFPSRLPKSDNGEAIDVPQRLPIAALRRWVTGRIEPATASAAAMTAWR